MRHKHLIAVSGREPVARCSPAAAASAAAQTRRFAGIAVDRPQFHRGDRDRRLSRHLPARWRAARRPNRPKSWPPPTTTTAPRPTPSRVLRYAMVLSTPGHAGSDPVVAQRLLREVLASPETLLPAERALAFLQLQQVERQQSLQADVRRLQTGAERTTRTNESRNSPAPDHRERGKYPSQEGACGRPGQTGRHRKHRRLVEQPADHRRLRDGNRRGF